MFHQAAMCKLYHRNISNGAITIFARARDCHKCNAQEGMEGNPAAKTVKNISQAFAALTIPFTASFPKAIFWITSNLFSLSYGLVIKNRAVKKALGIPIIPVQPRKEQKGLPFF